MKEYLRENPKGVFKVIPYDSSCSGGIEIPQGAEEYYWHNDESCCFFLKNVNGEKFYQYLDKSGWLKWEDFNENSLSQFKLKWKRNKLQGTVDKYNATEHGEAFYKFDLLGKGIKPVKSDGGSSSYYFTELPEHLIKDIVKRGGIEIKDIVRYCFDNDADCKDIIKALKRIRENLKGGGKEGVDNIYDANKICFFAEELRTSLKECSKHV